MSFRFCKAGKTAEVIAQLGELDLAGDKVAEATRAYVATVLSESKSEGVIIEADGHDGSANGGQVFVNLRIAHTL